MGWGSSTDSWNDFGNYGCPETLGSSGLQLNNGGRTACMILCMVCSEQLDRERFHYGGLSCSSCRSFFRRITARGMDRICRASNNCLISQENRSECIPCRYDRCLKIGMNPSFVTFSPAESEKFIEMDNRNFSFQPSNKQNFQPGSLETLTNSNCGSPMNKTSGGYQSYQGFAAVSVIAANPQSKQNYQHKKFDSFRK